MNKNGEKTKLLAVIAVFAMVAFSMADESGATGSAETTEPTTVTDTRALASGVQTAGFNIKLGNDIDITSTLTVSVAGTIDLNGFTLKCTGADTITVANGGDLTIVDSSAQKTGAVDAVTHAKAALSVQTGGKATLNGGTFLRSAEAGTYEPYANGGNSYYTILNKGTLTIDGATVENKGGYSSNINNLGIKGALANLHIISGTLNGGVNAVKNDENGVCVIDNGTFGNTVQAVLMNWETMTVNGGTFNGQVMCIVNGTWADEGSEPSAGALTLNGGTFVSGDNYPTIQRYNNTSYNDKVTLGTITVSDAVANVSILVPDGCDASGTVAFGANKVTLAGTAGEGGITFSKGSVTISGNIVSGSGSAGEVAAAISGIVGDVVLEDLTVSSGTLTINGDVEVRGAVNVSGGAGITVGAEATMTVARGATLTNEGTLTANGDIVSNGNIVNKATITGNDAGSITGNVDNSAEGAEISGVDISGAVSSADILEYTISGGDVSDDTTIPANQRLIVAEGGVWTIESGVTLTILGELVIDGTLVVNDGATVIVGNTTGLGAKVQVNGNVQTSGTFSVVNGNVIVDNTFDVIEGQLAVQNGEVTVDGELTIGADALVYSGGFTSGRIVVNADGNLNIYGLVGDAYNAAAYIINYGNVTIDNGQAERLTAEGEAADPVSNKLFIRGYADGSVVTVNSYLLETNGSELRVNDYNMELGTGSNVITTGVNGVPYNQISFANAGSDAVILSGPFVITQDVSGSAARGFTHTLDVSGNIYAAYVDTEGQPNDPSDLVNMSIAGARYAADADNKGGVIVSTTLGIDKTVKVSNSGVLDVSGQLSMPESTIANSGVVSIVGEDGFIQVNTAINNDVNGVMYQTREGAAPGTPYVNYASFANAIAGVTAETNLNNSKTVTVLGEVTVSADVSVPSPVSVVVTGELIVGTSDDRDVSVTIAAGAKSSGSGKITVNGSLTYDNKRNDGVADTIADVVMEDEARDGYRTYTNIYTALADATDGSTVTVSKVGGYVDVSENITVPEGVTLVVPNGSAPLVLADGVTMTVDGTLETAVDIYAETMFAVSASDIDSSTVTGENASAIVVNGTIVSSDEIKYGLTIDKTGTVSGITGNVAAATNGVPVAGAYYETVDGYVISALDLAISADVLADIISEKIIVNGAVTVGDITFATEEDCAEIEVATKITAPAGMTAPETVLTVGSMTLTGTKLTVNGAFNGDVVVGDSRLTVANVTAVTVEDSEGMLVTGTNVAKIGDENVEATITVAAGAPVFGNGSGSFVAFDVTVTVAAGATAVSNGAKFDEIVVDGTLDITSATRGVKTVEAAVMTVNEGGSVEIASGEQATITGDLIVYGSFSVATATSTSAAGTAGTDNLFVGFTLKDAKKGNEAAAGTVNGPVSVNSLAYVSPEAVVDDAVMAVLDDMKQVEFMVENSLWFTAYTNGSVTTPADVPVDNVKLTGWAVSGTTTPATTPVNPNTPYSVSEDCVLTANIDRNIYVITIYANEAVDDIFIDGQIMQKGMFMAPGAGGLSLVSGYQLTVAAGNHSITYTLKNGYDGEGVVGVVSGNTTVSGTTFTTSGIETADTNITLQLTGFDKVGYVPDSPDTGDSGSSDSGMTITDYLLIVLVVLIIVMAIIVAMRLMRS